MQADVTEETPEAEKLEVVKGEDKNLQLKPRLAARDHLVERRNVAVRTAASPREVVVIIENLVLLHGRIVAEGTVIPREEIDVGVRQEESAEGHAMHDQRGIGVVVVIAPVAVSHR